MKHSHHRKHPVAAERCEVETLNLPARSKGNFESIAAACLRGESSGPLREVLRGCGWRAKHANAKLASPFAFSCFSRGLTPPAFSWADAAASTSRQPLCCRDAVACDVHAALFTSRLGQTKGRRVTQVENKKKCGSRCVINTRSGGLRDYRPVVERQRC